MKNRPRLTCLAAATALSLLMGLLIAPISRAEETDAPSVAPTIQAPDAKCGENNAFKNGDDTVTFGGTATGGSSIESVTLQYFDSAGNIVFTRDVTSFVSIDDQGALSGSTKLIERNKPVSVRAVAVVSLNSIPSPEGVSTAVPFDRTAPFLTGGATSSPSSVVVRFSEQVVSSGGEFATDWKVDGMRPISIDGQGATRTLGLSPQQKLGQDDQPAVEYAFLFASGGYKDCGRNDIDFNQANGHPWQFEAEDEIAPAIPRINLIDGKDAAANVFSQNESPTVVVDQVTDGHTVTLFRETTAAPQFDPEADEALGTAEVVNGTATFASGTLPSFATDGTYTLFAMATDVHGNPSEDAGGNPGADVATYTLDRIAPQQSQATSTGSKVTVTFTEGLVGANDKAQWTITGCPTGCTVANVTGGGDTRVLELATGQVAPNGAHVSWTRPESGGYTDRAENQLLTFSSLTTQGFIPRTIDVNPETASPAAGTTASLNISVLDDLGQPRPGTLVGVRAFEGPSKQRDFDGNGPNPAGTIGSCFTGANGTCQFQYASNAADLDKLQAWIDSDDNVATIETPSPEPLADDDPTGKPNQDVVTVGWVAESAQLLLDGSPETATSPVGHPHIVTAQVNATDGDIQSTPRAAIESVTVGLRALSGPNIGFLDTCETDAQGRCQLTYVSTETGTDQLQTWIDRNDDGVASASETGDTERADADNNFLLNQPNQDVMTKTWSPEDIIRLDLEPENSTQDPGRGVDLVFKVFDGSGQGIEGLDVLARVFSGPNAGKKIVCHTDSTGRCDTSYTSSAGGVDMIQAWIDADGDGTSNEASANEPLTESSGTDDPGQDVVRVTWRTPDINIHVTPKTVTKPVGQTASFEVSAADGNGNPKDGITIAARVLSGPNAGSSALTCTTSAVGRCSVAYDGFKVGRDLLQVWVGGAMSSGPTPEKADATGADDQPTQDIASIDWTTQGANLVLDLNPETSELATGKKHELTLSVKTPAGTAIEGAPLAAKVVSGPGTNAAGGKIGSCASGPSGTCKLSYASSSPGHDVVSGWTDSNGDGSPNEVVGGPEPRDATGATDVANQDTVDVDWVGEARTITLTASTTKTVFGKKVTLSGSVTGNSCGDGAVRIVRLYKNGSVDVLKTMAASGNTYEFVMRATSNGRFGAILDETDACGGATSQDVMIKVKAKVTAETFRSAIARGTCTAITGIVKPSKAGQRVALQKRGPFGWTRVTDRKLDRDSMYSLPVCLNEGSATFRVRWAGDRANVAGVSRAISIATR